MKLQLIAAAALATAFTVSTPAVADEADLKAECAKYAQEDGVPADEMQEYLAQCMKDMASADSEGTGDAPAEDEGKE